MHRHQVAAPADGAGKFPDGVSFVNGNVGIAFATSPGRGQDTAVGGKFEWDLMFHPIGPRTNKRHVFVNTQANIVTGPAATRGVFDQAVKLVSWISTSKPAQDLMVEIGPNAIPASKAALNSPRYLAGPPVSQRILLDMVPAYRDPEIFIGWNDWRNAVHAALLPAFAGQNAVSDAAKEAARAGDVVLAKIPR